MPSTTTVSDSLYKALEELGLTDYERTLYALSIQLGPTSTATLAEHLKLPRSNVYKVITGLQKKGLAQFSGRDRYSRTFMVESPSTVIELLRKKMEQLTERDLALGRDIPILLALYKQGAMPSKVKVIHDRKQFLSAFVQVMQEAKDEVLFFGSFKDFISFLGRDFGVEYSQKRAQRGVPVRALMLPSAEATERQQNDKADLRETRIYQGKQPFVTSFYLFANKVIFWQPKTPIAVQIEDEYIVAMLKDIFEVLWSISPGTTS